MRFHRFSVLAILSVFFPLAVWADDPGAGGAGADGKPTDAKLLTQADIDKAVQAALAERDSKWTEQFKAATGHDSLQAFQEAEARRKGEEGKLLDQRTAELEQTRSQLAQANISTAILGAATEAVDPATVLALLSGKAKFENGVVTVDGKPPAEAVKALLAEKPFLAKAGPSGSGTPPAGGGGAKPTLTRAAFEALTPADQQKHIKAGGTVTD